VLTSRGAKLNIAANTRSVPALNFHVVSSFSWRLDIAANSPVRMVGVPSILGRDSFSQVFSGLFPPLAGRRRIDRADSPWRKPRFSIPDSTGFEEKSS